MERRFGGLAAIGRQAVDARRGGPPSGQFKQAIMGVDLIATPELDPRQSYVDRDGRAIYFNDDVFEELAEEGQLGAVWERLWRSDDRGVVDVSEFLVKDAGRYAGPLDVPSADPDRLSAIGKEIDGLLTAAAGLNRSPSELQRRIFAERLVEAGETLAELSVELDMIRHNFDLASETVADALES